MVNARITQLEERKDRERDGNVIPFPLDPTSINNLPLLKQAAADLSAHFAVVERRIAQLEEEEARARLGRSGAERSAVIEPVARASRARQSPGRMTNLDNGPATARRSVLATEAGANEPARISSRDDGNVLPFPLGPTTFHNLAFLEQAAEDLAAHQEVVGMRIGQLNAEARDRTTVNPWDDLDAAE
ncbi:uncharacterized protein BDV17DRAFT_288525 [Aspergillus undulatus]|uniref:uncharacterized protein n=1 Tax=Aspergillus undulatus TaxID=1810928 RepID=UPI003CCD7F6D